MSDATGNEPTAEAAPAEWYPDPENPGQLRYWDGAAWTDHRAAGASPTAAATPTASASAPASGTNPLILDAAATGGAGAADARGTFSIGGHRVASPWARFGCALLETVLSIVTLGIGWIIWACFLVNNGQTPARKLLGQQVINLNTGKPATAGTMIGMRGIVGGTVFQLSFYVLAGFVLMFMPFWDKKNQTVVDKISSTVVVTL